MATDSLWGWMLAAVEEHESVALVVVAEASGSVPGKPGAMIAVTAGATCGTIGGGVAEHRLVDRARAHRGPGELVDFHHVAESGSLCQGRQTFAMVQVAARDEPALRSLAATLEADGHGVLHLDPGGLGFDPGHTTGRRLLRRGGTWSYEQTVGTLETLFIIGGGHVALALSRVMATLPFRVVVLDDRADLATMRDNTWASETRVISYSEVARHVPEGEHTYAVIMTHGHRGDEAVLGHLADRRLAYLGMMGSTAKVKAIADNLAARGVSRESLARVHAPVGLPIGSHSPAEIAISIAAEIVRVRSQSQGSLR